MVTYEMTLTKESDAREVSVSVDAETYTDAVKTLKARYGKEWMVSSSRIVHAK